MSPQSSLLKKGQEANLFGNKSLHFGDTFVEQALFSSPINLR